MNALKLQTVIVSFCLIMADQVGGADRPPGLSTDELVAWCVVPFDASKRGPEERAMMLSKLGFSYCAYDWRPGDEESFEAEIEAYQKHGICLLYTSPSPRD